MASSNTKYIKKKTQRLRALDKEAYYEFLEKLRQKAKNTRKKMKEKDPFYWRKYGNNLLPSHVVEDRLLLEDADKILVLIKKLQSEVIENLQ